MIVLEVWLGLAFLVIQSYLGYLKTVWKHDLAHGLCLLL